MRYRVFFVSGKEIVISDIEYTGLINQAQKSTTPVVWYVTQKNQLINLTHMTHVEPEDNLDGNSGIVTPPSVDEVKDQKKREHEEKVSNPDAILAGVKEREAENEPDA